MIWKVKDTILKFKIIEMNKTLKIVLIVLNAVMLVLALYWYRKESQIEPIIVFIGQVASILILLFENKISKNSIKKISDSKVRISTTKGDESHIEIKNVKKGSDVKIKRK